MKNAVLLLRDNVRLMNNSDKKIAEYILAHTELVAQMNIQELAKASFTSPSTIYRMCCSLGFQGYKEFKQSLIFDVTMHKRDHRRENTDIGREDSIDQIIEKVTYKSIISIEDTKNLMNPENVEQCVQLLLNARMILMFGIGASFGVARDAYLKFLRLNKPCAINEDWHSQLLTAKNARPEDVGIVISYSGETVEILECMKEMRKNGTPIIAITRFVSSPVSKLADYTLYTADNESLFRRGAMSSRICQLNVIDILYTVYAYRQYEDTSVQLAKTHINKKGLSSGFDLGD